jgi:hypothetical protein
MSFLLVLICAWLTAPLMLALAGLLVFYSKR